MFTRRHDNPIGLDLGAAAVKAAQRDARGRMRAVALPRREPGSESVGVDLNRLRGVLGQHGFEGRRVVLAGAHERVITELLKLPPAGPGVPQTELARAELARARQLQPGTFEAGLWPVPVPVRGGDGAHVMTSAYRHEDANALLDAVEAHGFEPVALETPACAVARGCAATIAGSNGIVALIDFGHSAARLTLMLGGVIIFERSNADAGLANLHASLCDTLQVDGGLARHLLATYGLTPRAAKAGEDPAWRSVLAEAYSLTMAHFDHASRELVMSFAYAGHRYPDAAVSRAVLLGGGAAIAGLGEYLASTLGVPAEPITPRDLALLDDAVCEPASVAQAVGLAQYGRSVEGVAA